MSFRASAHTGVGIPRLERKCHKKQPEKLGDCHTSDIGHWFAMTCINPNLSHPLQLLDDLGEVFRQRRENQHRPAVPGMLETQRPGMEALAA